MPGRQAHGRPLIAAKDSGGKGKNKRSKAKASSKALNAYAAAQAEVGEQQKRTQRNRQLDADLNDGAPRGKHARNDEEDDDEDDDEDEAPPRKMRRGEDEDQDVEYGSDSSGNSWRVGVVDDDDDSEIDSDEAFGESDEERFEDFKFPGSKKNGKNKKKQVEEDDSDDDDEDDDIGDADGASLGSDAIDLADALDMSMSEDDEQPNGARGEDEDEDDSDSDAEDEDSGDESSDVESDADHAEEGDINAWVSQFAGTKDAGEEEAQTTVSKPKIGLKDLGLFSVKDAELKKSLKLMSKDERGTKKQKLEIPLARRAQAKLDRSAAYEKTNESLGRWLDTVKAMRRTDTSLVFPLPQHETGLARHDNSELAPLNQKTAGTELESTIMAIMEESGLSLSAKPKEQVVMVDEDGQTISRKAMLLQKRRERELQSREEARAKRIKKIKSKAFRRVHRRQGERDEMKEREIMVASGEIDSEEEREALDRQRAMERMGDRHRQSKWAKQANKDGRAAWDEDVRTGVTEMARRDQELRRRIEGKSVQDDESDDSDDSAGSSVDERVKLLRKLKEVDTVEDSEPKSKLMNMEFMKKAEARRKLANDELIADMRRELASDADDQSESDHGPEDIGRRAFGQSANPKNVFKASKANKKAKEERAEQVQEDTSNVHESTTSRSKVLSAPAPQDFDNNGTAGAWSQPTMSGSSKKQKGKKAGPSTDVLELDINSVVVSAQAQPSAPTPAKTKTKAQKNGATAQVEYSSDDEDQHLPVQFREQELIERAFGGLDVFEAEFQAEKDAAVEDDDEKTVETTLPGWGSWIGEGVTKREKNQRRFFTKKEGVKPDARKDFKNDRAIINEKRVKKNDKYLASQLPHQYESRAQYERSLRLPIGPEFLTKESFQDATKPRVIIKQGIIAPISKPTH
ncbi:Utp14-domain-containing protein [Xylariaceae sp. AK1471]|nr:Utp14-domain-containing protein [Xylariaceae sp. AK1471]